MTAPEAESGPVGEAPTDIPPGWCHVRNAAGADLLTIDRTHPNYPHEWQKRTESRHRQRLAAHPPLSGAIERIRGRFAGTAAWLIHRHRQAQTLRSAGDDDAARRITAEIEAVGPSFFDEVFAAVRDVAIEVGPTDIPIGTRMAYLAEQSLPTEVRLPMLARRAEPFRILVNPGETTAEQDLYPGEVSITVAGIASRELGQTVAGFVTEAQEILGHADRRGTDGRKSKKEDPTKAEQARTAAKLHHWPSPAWSYAQIAELFGWQGKPDSVRERVRRAIRDGEDLLDIEFEGREWRFKPPPGIAERGC